MKIGKSSINGAYFRGATAIIWVYDITRKESYRVLETWLDIVKNNVDENMTLVLVGNKCDLDKDRKIEYEEGQKLAEEYGMLFYETSAKDDINIGKLFNDVASILKNKADDNLISSTLNYPHAFRLRNQNVANSGWLGGDKCLI